MKKPKHPKDMTTKELAKHLFHPEVVKHARKVARRSSVRSMGKQ
jgi:hypothetical protein